MVHCDRQGIAVNGFREEPAAGEFCCCISLVGFFMPSSRIFENRLQASSGKELQRFS